MFKCSTAIVRESKNSEGFLLRVKMIPTRQQLQKLSESASVAIIQYNHEWGTAYYAVPHSWFAVH